MPTPKNDIESLTLLGAQVREARKQIECFDAPIGEMSVKFQTDEFTSLCPKTGQPDFASIEIIYSPNKLCIESKSLKLYLWTFRDTGAFIETLARTICDDLCEACQPNYMTVHVHATPRGGIAVHATASGGDI